jgi:hypothetical protein
MGEIQPGDEGRILACSSTGAHVKWASGDYSLVSTDDITPIAAGMTVESSLDDSLDVGGFAVHAAKDIYENEGPEGLLNQMAASGHLASFGQYAQDALDSITARIRHDPSFLAVTSRLDDTEADHLVRLASVVLMRDAFGFGEE